MKVAEAILTAAMLVGLVGCAARAKPIAASATPATPAPPQQPLSAPQTQVDLPRPQAFDPDSLATAPPPAAPPAEPPAPSMPAKPAQQQHSNTGVRPKPETPPPVENTTPPPRQQIQEILPANVQQRLRASAGEHRRQAQQLVAEAQRHNLTAQQQALVTRIYQFLKSSDDAETSGDLRSADDFAGRAHTLAKELQSGK